jgi:hypothetical protein
MDGSDARVLRNGHAKTALAGLSRLRIILCVALVKSVIRLILKRNCAYPISPHDEPGFDPTPGAKTYFTSSEISSCIISVFIRVVSCNLQMCVIPS